MCAPLAGESYDLLILELNFSFYVILEYLPSDFK